MPGLSRPCRPGASQVPGPPAGAHAWRATNSQTATATAQQAASLQLQTDTLRNCAIVLAWSACSVRNAYSHSRKATCLVRLQLLILVAALGLLDQRGDHAMALLALGIRRVHVHQCRQRGCDAGVVQQAGLH